ncbi:Hypothetical protein NCS54_00482400 [Fusarium falciforme]|uniref:Hypothetical protein n=1 Tax=Fusarium falciforme TaxID=195108 RepID=UPI0022FFF7E4|nr:Hypothetical protein NCS54_00482400 [Fusarium falciforme]WAO87512.1 Hypothetical protein NCS54_00482400 [Fusarium falciforme]
MSAAVGVDLYASSTNETLHKPWLPVSELPTTNLQQGAIAIIFLFPVLAFLVWGVRMYSRWSTKQVGIDDWLVTAAMVFSIGLTIPTYFFFKYEFIGFPSEDVPDTYNAEPSLFWNWIMQVLYNPILALVKSSVLIFLLRLGGHRRSIRWSIYALNTFNLAQMFAIFITVLCQTIPIRAYWDKSIKPQREVDSPLFYVSTAIITIITDFLVLLIPFWVFLGLKMRIAAKVGLIVVFLVGGVVTVVAIIRVHEFRKKFYHIDPNYDPRNSLGETLSNIEVNLAIIASCGPALRPLFRRMFPGLFSNKSSNEAMDYNTPSRYGNSTGIRHTTATGPFPLKDIHLSKTHTEIRGHSPNGSEEEIMTYNGIIRTTAVDVKYDQATLSDRESGREYIEQMNRSMA